MMSQNAFNQSSGLVGTIIQNEKKIEEEYKKNNPASQLIVFEKALRNLGYKFEIMSQVEGFLPKHRHIIIPLAMKLYVQSNLEKDKIYFLHLFHFRGFEECIPLLLREVYSADISLTIKGMIIEDIRAIHSRKYKEDYLRILAMTNLEDRRNPIISLVGDLRIPEAIPLLISALSEGKNITTNALAALGKYKKEELRVYFEEYKNDENKYYRQEAIRAIRKLDSLR